MVLEPAAIQTAGIAFKAGSTAALVIAADAPDPQPPPARQRCRELLGRSVAGVLARGLLTVTAPAIARRCGPAG